MYDYYREVGSRGDGVLYVFYDDGTYHLTYLDSVVGTLLSCLETVSRGRWAPDASRTTLTVTPTALKGVTAARERVCEAPPYDRGAEPTGRLTIDSPHLPTNTTLAAAPAAGGWAR